MKKVFTLSGALIDKIIGDLTLLKDALDAAIIADHTPNIKEQLSREGYSTVPCQYHSDTNTLYVAAPLPDIVLKSVKKHLELPDDVKIVVDTRKSKIN